jgi:peptidoglycan/LPS O-acetylase OafA/YrhL
MRILPKLSDFRENTDGDRNFGLDLMRAAAILLVLLSHSRALLGRSVEGAREIFIGGYLGVEIFFVLSGFLIGGILVEQIGPASTFGEVKNFWVRRWWRTIPAYLVWLTVEFAAAVAARGSDVLILLPKYLVFAQTLVWPEPPYPFNVSWSLAIEEWFYLLFPLIALPLCIRLRSSGRGLALACLIIIVIPTVLRLYYVFQLDAPWGPSIRNTTIVRLDAIAYGVLTALVLRYWPRFWHRLKAPGAFVGAALVIGSCAYVQIVDRQTDFFARTFIFSAVSVGLALSVPMIREIPRPRSSAIRTIVLYVSLWSYSAYLCHWTIRRVLSAANGKTYELGLGGPVSSVLLWLIFFAATAVVSAISYITVEKWGLRMRRRFSHRENHQV